MHFLKAAFVTAGFFVGFVLGKDLAIAVMTRAAAPSANAGQQAA